MDDIEKGKNKILSFQTYLIMFVDDSEHEFAESLSPSSGSEFHSDGSSESESVEEGSSGEEEEGLEDMQNGTFVESQIEGDFE